MDVSTQIRNLTHKLQINHLGLPEGIYRPDMLPAYPSSEQDSSGTSDDLAPQLTLEDEIIENPPQAPELSSTGHLITIPQVSSQSLALEKYEKDVRAAYMTLDYAEGYPTVNGMPFWYQLPFEPVDAFLCFEDYLDLGRQGARQVNALLHSPRILALPEALRPTIGELESAFHTYYWAARVKSFDLFSAAHRRKMRERMIMDTEDSHYREGGRLLQLFGKYLDVNGEELLETMTPKAALEMFKVGVQVQRISLGQSANGNNSNESVPPGASLEVVMRSMSQQAKDVYNEDNQGKADDFAQKTHDNRDNLRKMMHDPVMIQNAQELIIKLTQATQPKESVL